MVSNAVKPDDEEEQCNCINHDKLSETNFLPVALFYFSLFISIKISSKKSATGLGEVYAYE
jgi:hypothetical protein